MYAFSVGVTKKTKRKQNFPKSHTDKRPFLKTHTHIDSSDTVDFLAQYIMKFRLSPIYHKFYARAITIKMFYDLKRVAKFSIACC